MENKSHDHVKKPRAFSKGCIRGELMITPIIGTLTKRRYELVFGHSTQAITTEVVRMLYPRDTEHVRYKIRSDHSACTLKASNKKRYWIIKSMHVGVELLNQHGWIGDRDITQWLPTPTVKDNGSVSVREVWQNDLAFRMNASSREVLKEVCFGLLITEPNRRWSRVRRSGCPGAKRVSGRSRLTFRCRDATNVN